PYPPHCHLTPVSLALVRPTRVPHSFPTRRSSDLDAANRWMVTNASEPIRTGHPRESTEAELAAAAARTGGTHTFRFLETLEFAADRKSTRLNSSHQIISYAVFCLKKKKVITFTNN